MSSNDRQTCPDCRGSGWDDGRDWRDWAPPGPHSAEKCSNCNGRGWWDGWVSTPARKTPRKKANRSGGRTKDKRLACPHCGVKTWSTDWRQFMQDHDRPDGRRCLLALQDVSASDYASSRNHSGGRAVPNFQRYGWAKREGAKTAYYRVHNYHYNGSIELDRETKNFREAMKWASETPKSYVAAFDRDGWLIGDEHFSPANVPLNARQLAARARSKSGRGHR